jgi:SAM-dependent methyltransferase
MAVTVRAVYNAALTRALSLASLYLLERACVRKVSKSGTFVFKGERLPYCFHSYNNFGVTERAVEIPIIKQYLSASPYERVLEIGNVTNHYYDTFRTVFRHKDVVDKFETAYDVSNCDIAAYTVADKYDCVVSISTFEHMDSDLGRNPDYVKGASRLVSVAADNIKHVSDHLIRPGGLFVVTAPLRYNFEWDQTFYSDAFDRCGFASCRRYLLRRLNELHWVEVDVEAGRGLRPDPYSLFREYLSVVEFVK